MSRDEIIRQIKNIDKLDEYRIEQLKTIYEHCWYEESIKDPVHCKLMEDLTFLRLVAKRDYGKDWFK